MAMDNLETQAREFYREFEPKRQVLMWDIPQMMVAFARRVRAEAREPLVKALRQIKDEATLLALRENAVNAFQVIADHALASEAEK